MAEVHVANPTLGQSLYPHEAGVEPLANAFDGRVRQVQATLRPASPSLHRSGCVDTVP